MSRHICQQVTSRRVAVSVAWTVFAGLRLWYFKYLRVSQHCKDPKQADGEEGHGQGRLICLSKNIENSLVR